MKKYKATITCKAVSTVEVEALGLNEPGTVVDSEFEVEEA